MRDKRNRTGWLAAWDKNVPTVSKGLTVLTKTTDFLENWSDSSISSKRLSIVYIKCPKALCAFVSVVIFVWWRRYCLENEFDKQFVFL